VLCTCIRDGAPGRAVIGFCRFLVAVGVWRIAVRDWDGRLVRGQVGEVQGEGVMHARLHFLRPGCRIRGTGLHSGSSLGWDAPLGKVVSFTVSFLFCSRSFLLG
jgi:hypothetical protein